jgi:hypothetical protein
MQTTQGSPLAAERCVHLRDSLLQTVSQKLLLAKQPCKKASLILAPLQFNDLRSGQRRFVKLHGKGLFNFRAPATAASPAAPPEEVHGFRDEISYPRP